MHLAIHITDTALAHVVMRCPTCVRTLDSFRPSAHITTQNLSYDRDRNGFRVTVLHLPSTKAANSEGEDVYWATQEGDTDPSAALQNHL